MSGPRRSREPKVLLLPTSGSWDPERSAWRVGIEGWVHSERPGSRKRAIAARIFRELARRPKVTGVDSLLRERLRAFAVEDLAGVAVELELAGQRAIMPKTGADGRFSSVLWLSDEQVVAALGEAPAGRDSPALDSGPAWLAIELLGGLLEHAGSRPRVQLLPRRGTIVVCDIDDTIKISQVGQKRQLLANTFLHPYRAVPGMPEVLRSWHAAGAGFIYLSNSPVPLFSPLAEFIENSNLPPGELCLREFGIRDRSFLQMFDAVVHKRNALAAMVTRFPEQQLILVGDTGERDPETYAEFVGAHRERVRAVVLREHPGAAFAQSRRRLIADALASTPVHYFSDARELPSVLPS